MHVPLTLKSFNQGLRELIQTCHVNSTKKKSYVLHVSCQTHEKCEPSLHLSTMAVWICLCLTRRLYLHVQ